MGERIYMRPKGNSESVPKVTVRQLKAGAKPIAPATPRAHQAQRQGTVGPKTLPRQDRFLAKLGGLGIAAMVVAGISLFGLIVAVATRPDGSFEGQAAKLAEEKAKLEKSLEKLQVEREKLEASKASLQRRLDTAQNDKENLLAVLKRNAAASRGSPERGAAPEQVAQPNGTAPAAWPPPPDKPRVNETVSPTPIVLAPNGTNQRREDILAWTRTWSTLAFPARVTALKPFYLIAKADSQVKTPVRVGSPLLAISIRGDRLVVTSPKSKNFTAVVPVDATDYLQVIAPRFEAHSDKLTKRSGHAPASATDHGASCVCVECRKKKNGGSLFPGL